MRKIILASTLLAASVTGANAQDYVFDGSTYCVTPGDFITNGKATMVIDNSEPLYDYNGIVYSDVFDKESYTILDENLKEKKTLNFVPKNFIEHHLSQIYDGVSWFDNAEFDTPRSLSVINKFDYNNYDESRETSSKMIFTQTLFNNDDKWEYLVTEYEEGEVRTFVSSLGEFYTKSTGNFRRLKQLNVCSEDGDVLLSFYPSIGSEGVNHTMKVNSVWVMNGKTYLYMTEHITAPYIDRNTLYEIDRVTTSAKAVSVTESKKYIAEIQNGIIKVSIDEDDTDSYLTLSNAAGMIVDTQYMPKGKTNAEMDTHRLSKGVYNISLSRHGKVLNNQKFLVK